MYPRWHHHPSLISKYKSKQWPSRKYSGNDEVVNSEQHKSSWMVDSTLSSNRQHILLPRLLGVVVEVAAATKRLIDTRRLELKDTITTSNQWGRGVVAALIHSTIMKLLTVSFRRSNLVRFIDAIRHDQQQRAAIHQQ